MVKVGMFGGGNMGAAKELLRSLAANRSVEICQEAACNDADILVVSKAPEGSASCGLLSPRIVIANSDNRQVLQFVSRIGGQIITYGLNPKAAITVSSHDDDSLVMCVQRAMVTIHDTPILPREFSVGIKDYGGFDESIMGVVVAGLICGIEF